MHELDRAIESRGLKQKRQWNWDRRNENATTTKAQQQPEQQQKALAAATVASTISISSTQAMRLGAIKSNHFVLITHCEQRANGDEAAGIWKFMRVELSSAKDNTHLASKTIDFRAENWWKLAYLQFVFGCAERADLIVRCELWWSLLLLLSLLSTHCQRNRENKQKQRTNERTLHAVVIESSCYCLNYFLFCRFEVLVWSKK